MIFKRFIFFHFVVFGTMLPAYAQHTPNVDSEHNKTMEKKFQESVDVKGKNNLALPADDSVSIKTRLTIAGRKVESEADQGLKTQSREIKNASSAISQEVKANIGSDKTGAE